MNLEEKSRQIDNNLLVEKSKLLERLKVDSIKLEEQKEILRSDEASTDRSENALFQIAKDKFEMYSQSINTINNKIKAYDTYDTYRNSEYVSDGIIKLGSVVRIEHISTAGNPTPEDRPKEFVMKIVPADLGNARIGALSERSVCGSQLKGAKVGDFIKVNTHVGTCVYCVKEVY